MKCDSCKYWDKGLDEYPCNKCIHNAIEQFEPMTNFERIKAMSVGDLAEFICGIYDTDEDSAKYINGTIIPCYNQYEIEEWLEREVNR